MTVGTAFILEYGEIAFEEKAEKWADKMYPCDGQAQRYLLMGAKFGYNEKCSELENELKWERDTKTELAEHLGKANDKIADLEETINKLREQLALRYDLEDKIKELEEASKANEWHYPSKGEYPDNDNDILCQIDFETSEVGYFNEMYNNFFTIDGKEIEVKAWKEIVLPKLKESE